MSLSREEIERRWQLVDEAPTDDFATLVEVAGLDPARHLRRADWTGVSFRGSDLRGFDFSAARLHDWTLPARKSPALASPRRNSVLCCTTAAPTRGRRR